MPDDIRDLDTDPLFRIPVNFASDISNSVEYFRQILEFPGTKRSLINFSSDTIRAYQLEFLFATKEDEYNFLDFFHSREGDSGKFWFISEEIYFNSVDNINDIDTSIVVENNNFDKITDSNDRFCIRFRNGDFLTRLISEVTDIGNGQLRLSTNHTFGQNINLLDIYGIYEILPVRFDDVKASLQYKNSVVGQNSIKIKEVRGEV